MSVDLLKDKDTPLSQQRLSWKDMVGKPISKLDDDAFTRVRIILMNGVELDSLRTKQVALRMNRDARVKLAQLMRVEQHQAFALLRVRQRDEQIERELVTPALRHHLRK